jgi:hypothetical protein
VENFPSLTSAPSYEIRSNTVEGADGFLRIRSGGLAFPESASSVAYIDLSGFSRKSDMNCNIVLGTGGAERMRIHRNGNIGIGTASSTANNTFQVDRNARTGTHGSNLAAYFTKETSLLTDPIIEARHANGTQGVGIGWQSIVATGSNASQDLAYYTKGNGSHVFRDLTSTGRVGIGKNNPTSALDVNGTVTATSFSGNGIIPIGGIIMWSGTSAPAGWVLCNGSNDTPDLRDRFIMGAGNTHQPGTASINTTANITLTAANLPPHTHNYTLPTTGYAASYNTSSEVFSQSNNNGGSRTRTTATNTVAATPFTVAYYALAYIMRRL